MLHIFIGYDSREQDAYEVCAYSLQKFSTMPLAIHGLRQDKLREQGFYTRPANEPASTEFAFTRFLVPYLCNYKGTALFVDCDFLFTQDISKLLAWVQHEQSKVSPMQYSVACVKHQYTPRRMTKMDGQKQVYYPRKNWSSLMLFNNPQCRMLTPNYVNEASPQALHRMAWTADHQILGLPMEWNWLEGEYARPGVMPPAAIHFTNGGPWHQEQRAIDYGDMWVAALFELREMQAERQRAKTNFSHNGITRQ